MKCNDAFVSVILPVYNGENYLSEAIDSILDQTHKHYELIIQDDASTDNTKAIICNFNDKRIKYQRNAENCGMASNINKGIMRSKGDYLSLFSQDDRMLPSYLEKQIAHLEKNRNVGFSFSTAFKIDQTGRRLYRASHTWDDQHARTPAVATPAEGLFLLLNYGCLPGNISPIVIRKKCLNEVGLFKEHYVMPLDWDMCIRLTSKFGFAFLNERLLEIRRHSKQTSRQNYNIYHNMRESLECLSMLKHELSPYFLTASYWPRKVKKGIARKYGEIYMHNVLTRLLGRDMEQSVLCAKLLSRNIGLFWSAIYWLAYLPDRIKRRVSGHGQDHMSSVFNNHDLQVYMNQVH